MSRFTAAVTVILVIFASLASGLRRSDADVVKKPKTDHRFIDKVHELSYDIAKETVIQDNQVVWSPYSVVNILPLINGDNSLKDSFNSSLAYLRSIEGLTLNRISVAITNKNVVGSDYETKVVPFPADNNVTVVEQLVKDAFKNETGVEAPPGFVPEGSLVNATDVFLTSLGLSLNWEVPFHYGNSRVSRFYINSTHAIKTKYLVNVGYYKYAELEDIDARVIALPLKDAPTTFFMVVLPNDHDGLEEVSTQFGQRNVTDIFSELKTRRVYLRLPKINVDNQLIFNAGTAKIIQAGSLHLSYGGIESNGAVSPQQRIKFKQLKRRGGVAFRIENPFIFMIYETTRGGILNYGEVLIPTERSHKPSFKYQQNVLSQNGKIISEAVDKLGDDLYASIRKRTANSFVFSPLSLTNLIGSLLSGAEEETKNGILSKLNFPLMWQDALKELNEKGHINETVTRVNVVVKGEPKDSYRKLVSQFGTNVVSRQSRDFTTNYTVKSVLGASDYEINPQLNTDWKTFVGKFYRNEVDAENVTYLDFHTSGFKYLYVPFWDAKIISIPLNDGINQTLLLVVPGERSGLNLIEDGIVEYPVSKLLCQGNVRRLSVRVRLPLLNLEHITDFGDHLKELGMPQFQTGDFSGIVQDGRLDQIVQRALLNLTQIEILEEDSNESNIKTDTLSSSSSSTVSPTTTVVPVPVNVTTTTTEKVTTKSSRVSRKNRRNSYRPNKRPQHHHNKKTPSRNHKSSKLVKIDRPFVFYVQDARVGTVLVGRYVGSSSPLPTVVTEDSPLK